MSISAWDTKVSMLFSSLLANIRILSCFFFLLLILVNNFFIIPVVKENIIINPALAIPTWAPTTVAWETVQTPTVVAERTIKSIYVIKSSNILT